MDHNGSSFTYGDNDIYEPEIGKEIRDRKYAGWKVAVGTVLTK